VSNPRSYQASLNAKISLERKGSTSGSIELESDVFDSINLVLQSTRRQENLPTEHIISKLRFSNFALSRTHGHIVLKFKDRQAPTFPSYGYIMELSSLRRFVSTTFFPHSTKSLTVFLNVHNFLLSKLTQLLVCGEGQWPQYASWCKRAPWLYKVSVCV